MTPVRTERNARRRNPRRPWTRGTAGAAATEGDGPRTEPGELSGPVRTCGIECLHRTGQGPGRAAPRRVDPTRPIGRTRGSAPAARSGSRAGRRWREHRTTAYPDPRPRRDRRHGRTAEQDFSLLLHLLCIPGRHRRAGRCAGTRSVPHPRSPDPGLQPGPLPCTAAGTPATGPRTPDATQFSQPERSK